MRVLRPRQLKKEIAAFLAFKRALGYQYLTGETTLRRFEDFAVSQSGARSTIGLKTIIHRWLRRGPRRKPVTLANELGYLRQFCLYLRRSDPKTFVPPVSLAPHVRSHYVPYIFSLDEIRRLIQAAEQPQGGRSWPAALRMLLIVTYCTGLRLGEAVRLQLDDLDQVGRVLNIRESKGRNRIVPFRKDLAREFARYLRERTELLCSLGLGNEPALFVDLSGHAVSVHATSNVIRRLLRRLGMKSPRGRSGPRPYDLRHAFAVHRLTAWYHDRVNLYARLPLLSAYMGHLDLLGTEVYLHATPELLELASKRFATRFDGHGTKT